MTRACVSSPLAKGHIWGRYRAMAEELSTYIHAARNCTQMLSAIDRRLARARDALEAGEIEECKTYLDQLKEALPQAIRVIDHDNVMSKADGD